MTGEQKAEAGIQSSDSGRATPDRTAKFTVSGRTWKLGIPRLAGVVIVRTRIGGRTLGWCVGWGSRWSEPRHRWFRKATRS